MPTIIRVEHSKNRPYLTIASATIRELRHDLQALGLLVDLLNRPDGWRIRPDELVKELGGVSRATLYRTLGRLIEEGYVQRIDVTRRLDDGRFERRTSYTVFEDKTGIPGFDYSLPSSVHTGNVEVKYDGEAVPF